MSKEECGKIGYIYEEDGERRCVDKEGCYGLGFFLDDRCVSAATCKREGKYAYGYANDCSADEPDENGHFDKDAIREESVYTCSEDEYPMLDLTGKKRRCVGDMACLYVLKGLRTENNVCVTREAWLAQNPRNFVDKRFEAVQY